ncbi:MAG: tetratricopeptide repeat protein, partial [Pseudolabrys sp.]
FNWSDRGDAYRAAGDLDHALADYGAAIDRKPGDSRFWHGRAITYQALGDNAHALADLDK